MQDTFENLNSYFHKNISNFIINDFQVNKFNNYIKVYYNNNVVYNSKFRFSDFSIQRLVANGSFDKLFATYIDTKDNIHICYYKYNNLNYSCWLDYLTLYNTNCIDCKINFLGTWTTNTTETDKNLYVTETLPCITYINKNKELCFINSANIKLIAENHAENVLDYVSIVDTNVSNFSCCLGYRTTAKPENDQGLVISYIKDNKVYYVSYYYDLESNKLTLSSSYKLGNYTNATGVSVTRTNDYRLAFLVHTTDNENYVHITERSYIGSAVKDEIGNLNNIKYLNYITLQNVNYTIDNLLTRNTYLDTEDNHKVIIEYLTELYNPYNELNYEYLKNYITVKTTANRVLELTNIEINKNKLIITFKDIVDVNINIIYTYSNIYNCIYLNLSSVPNMGGIYPMPSFTQYLKCREDKYFNQPYEIGNLSSVNAKATITLKEIPKIRLNNTEIGNLNTINAKANIKLPLIQNIKVNSLNTATYKIENEISNLNIITATANITLEHIGTSPI